MNVRPPPYSNFPPPPGAPAAAPAAPSPREKVARLKTLTRRAFAYWKLSLFILVVGSGAALWAAMAVKLIYRSECTIQYKPAMRTGDRGEESEKASRVGEKLKDVLTTRTRLEALIRQYKLYPKIVESRGMVEAVEGMRPHIGFRARDSETFVISFENEIPDTARQVTTALADSMISEFTSSSLNAARQTADFLGKQEQRSATDVENANKALVTFLTLHPEFATEAKTTPGAPGSPAPPMLPHMPKESAQTLGDPQLGVLFRQKMRLEAELRTNNAGGSAPAPAPAAGAGGGESIAKLTIQRDQAAKAAAAAAFDLAQKGTVLTPEHPDYITAKLTAEGAARRLHEAELALAAAQGGAAVNPYDVPTTDANVQRRIAQLNAEIAARQEAVRHSHAPTAGADAAAAAATGETNELVQLETEWPRLLSVLQDRRKEHEELQHKLEVARLDEVAKQEAGGDQMMVIDPAYKPLHPSAGGRTKTAIGGGVVALLLALAYAFARVFFNDTLIDSADVESLQLLPVLGVLPKVRPWTPAGTAPSTSKDVRRVV